MLSPEQVDDLVPDEESLYVIRLVTYGGVIVTTYHVSLEPMFFEHEKTIVPSGNYQMLFRFHVAFTINIRIPSVSVSTYPLVRISQHGDFVCGYITQMVGVVIAHNNGRCDYNV